MEKEYFYYDPDTGAKIPCSKEFLEGMKKIWDEAKPKLLQGHKVRNVIITGTTSEINPKANPEEIPSFPKCKHGYWVNSCGKCYEEATMREV